MDAATLGAIIAIAVGYVASIFAIIWYLGGRIDHIESRMETRMDRSDEILQGLRLGVAVLKATC